MTSFIVNHSSFQDSSFFFLFWKKVFFSFSVHFFVSTKKENFCKNFIAKTQFFWLSFPFGFVKKVFIVNDNKNIFRTKSFNFEYKIRNYFVKNFVFCQRRIFFIFVQKFFGKKLCVFQFFRNFFDKTKIFSLFLFFDKNIFVGNSMFLKTFFEKKNTKNKNMFYITF